MIRILKITGLALLLNLSWGTRAADDDTIKIGVLHSLSGTMAISETTLKDTILMMVEDQNAKGGLLGKKTRGSGGRPGFRLAALC